MKRKATHQEKIFANHISEKGLVARIYNEHSHRNKKTTQFKKWAKYLSRHFTIEDIQMASVMG